MADTNDSYRLVWIDCEMTGLDVDNDVIIEIFCIITDGNLDVLEKEGWGAVIQQSKETMDKMGEWCTRTHGNSGLTEKVLNSKITPEQASAELVKYIKRHIPEANVARLAGNSVHADKAFLCRAPYKKVIEHLHYRIFDVSTMKEAANMWCSSDALESRPRKQLAHMAKADILESIEEAKFYKTIFEMVGK